MTRDELIDRVLIKLRVLEPGKTAGTDDDTLVGDKYDAIYQSLNNVGLVNWASDDEITSTHELSIIKIVSAECADDFYIEEPRYTRLQIEAYGPRLDGQGGAMADLRILENQPYVSDEEPEYY